ncbi:hypothetical protein DFH11DRAFT_1748523 [Phellopilus nigrolimitatus]|nr:hypothetical protein DFH11DRAFT_1748523 [Phellopilus nigrolimitatus]
MLLVWVPTVKSPQLFQMSPHQIQRMQTCLRALISKGLCLLDSKLLSSSKSKKAKPILGLDFNPLMTTNQQFVLASDPTTRGKNVTIRILEVVQQTDPDISRRGYVSNAVQSGFVQQSQTPQVWTLDPVAGHALQFRILDFQRNAITYSPSADGDYNHAYVLSKPVNAHALTQRWIFVPVDQVKEFVAENQK